MPDEGAQNLSASGNRFPVTHWSQVLRASHGDGTRSQEALARLCQTYWYPLYAFVRRHGRGPEDAQDLTQAFFAHLLENHALATVDPAKGMFRSFLLASLRNFMANERDRAQTQKRGSGQAHLRLDAASAETRYGLEPADHASPDRVFERNWVLALLEQVLERLRAEQAAAGKGAQFEQLRDCLVDSPDAPRYAALAGPTGLHEEAVRTAVSRLRRRYRELLREEIAQTVSSLSEIEEEVRHLFAVLRS
jgi:RNA polymerase sigma factor (sigma-70 family)